MKDANTPWLPDLNDWVAETMAAIFSTLPSIIAAIAILVIGWFVARLGRSLVRKLSHGTNRIMERVFRTGGLASARLSAPMIAAIAEVAFWVVIFIAITIAMRVGGFTLVSSWLDQIVVHLPNLIAGLSIIALGFFSSVYAGKLVDSGGGEQAVEKSLLPGLMVRGFIFTTMLIIGLDQLGVEVTFLIALLTVVTGTILIGFSIAFGLGARAHVSNLIAARSARNLLQVGLTIRICGVEGSVLEVSSSHIVLETEAGQTLIPTKMIDENMVEILTAHEVRSNG